MPAPLRRRGCLHPGPLRPAAGGGDAKLRQAGNRDVHDDSKETTLPIARAIVQTYVQSDLKAPGTWTCSTSTSGWRNNRGGTAHRAVPEAFWEGRDAADGEPGLLITAGTPIEMAGRLPHSDGAAADVGPPLRINPFETDMMAAGPGNARSAQRGDTHRLPRRPTVAPGKGPDHGRVDALHQGPTCGMSVHVATALHAVRDGRTYSFCSDQCLARFQAVSAGEAGTLRQLTWGWRPIPFAEAWLPKAQGSSGGGGPVLESVKIQRKRQWRGSATGR